MGLAFLTGRSGKMIDLLAGVQCYDIIGYEFLQGYSEKTYQCTFIPDIGICTIWTSPQDNNDRAYDYYLSQGNELNCYAYFGYPEMYAFLKLDNTNLTVSVHSMVSGEVKYGVLSCITSIILIQF